MTRCYAIEGAGRVKIGKAKDVPERLLALQTGSPVLLRVLATAPNDNGIEHRVHFTQRARRLHGEWFDEALRDFILNASFREVDGVILFNHLARSTVINSAQLDELARITREQRHHREETERRRDIQCRRDAAATFFVRAMGVFVEHPSIEVEPLF